MKSLSQRDERTQPGVLTPGYEKKKASRRRGGRSFLPNDGSIYATTDKYLPPLSSFVPFSRTTADRQGGRSSDRYPGLKPQAESSRPFGTITSLQGPPDLDPHRLIAVQSPNEHNTHIAKLRPAFTQEAFPSRFRLREMLPNFCRMIRSYAVLQ